MGYTAEAFGAALRVSMMSGSRRRQAAEARDSIGRAPVALHCTCTGIEASISRRGQRQEGFVKHGSRARQAGFLALPHELPLRCVRTVERTSCVGHERQEGDAHLSMCWAKACLQDTRGEGEACRLGRGLGEACRLSLAQACRIIRIPDFRQAFELLAAGAFWPQVRSAADFLH